MKEGNWEWRLYVGLYASWCVTVDGDVEVLWIYVGEQEFMLSVTVREWDANSHSVRVVAITHVLQPTHCLYILYNAVPYILHFL